MSNDLLQPLDSCFMEHQGVGVREPLGDRGFRQTGLEPNGHEGCLHHQLHACWLPLYAER